MSQVYWDKQYSEPIFPDFIWARPEQKSSAGKLFIIGGTAQGFAGAVELFNEATQAGIGTSRIILPQPLKKLVGKLFPEAEFAPSTPSGSFAIESLVDFIDGALWADGVAIAPDTGNNSETTQLLQAFLDKYSGLCVLTGDAIETLMVDAASLLDRNNTVLILSFDNLQKLATASRFDEAFTSDMALLQLIERLEKFGARHAPHLMIQRGSQVIVCAEGKVSVTEKPDQPNLAALSAHAATWLVQNPTKPYQALTTAAFKKPLP